MTRVLLISDYMTQEAAAGFQKKKKKKKKRHKYIHISYAWASGPAGFELSSGWRAFTTMVMFGRKSASYWTHNAATAASWRTILPENKYLN